MAIGATVIAGVAVFGLTQGLAVPLSCAALIFAIGLADDIISLKPSTKLVIEVAIACVFLTSQYRLNWVSSLTLDMLQSLFREPCTRDEFPATITLAGDQAARTLLDWAVYNGAEAKLREGADLDERDRAGGPACDPNARPRPRCAHGNGDSDSREEAGEDSDAPEHRRGSLVPAIRARSRAEPGDERGAKQEPDGRGRGWKCSDRRERLHGAEA